MIVLIL